MQQWLTEQTGGARLRVVAGAVPTVRIGKTDAQIAARGAFVRDRVEELLRLKGYDGPYRLYAVWYDGTSTFSCGEGAWPPELAGYPATPPTARPTACMRARPLRAVCARRWARRLGLA
jgi:hypothetical protein